MTATMVAAVGGGFLAALVVSLITAYVQLVVRTAPVGRRLVEATAARQVAEDDARAARMELALYAESVAAWQHYAHGIEEQLADARATISHLAGRHRLNGGLAVDDVTQLPAADVVVGEVT